MFKLPKVSVSNAPAFKMVHRKDTPKGYKFIAQQKSVVDYFYDAPVVEVSQFDPEEELTTENLTPPSTSACPTYVQEGQTVQESFVLNSFKLRGFYKKHLTKKEAEKLTSQLYSLFFGTGSFGCSPDFELISESLTLSFGWQYQQPPSLQMTFESKSMFLQEQFNDKNYLFVFNGFKYRVKTVSCELIKSEKKAYKTHYKYNLGFDYFAIKDMEKEFSLYDISALKNAGASISTNSSSSSAVTSQANPIFITVPLSSLSNIAKEIFKSKNVAFTYFDSKIQPSLTDTTSIASELNKAMSVTDKTISYEDQILFKTDFAILSLNENDIFADIPINQSFNEKENLQFLPVAVDSLDTVKKEKDKSKPFTFVSVPVKTETVVTGDDASQCPYSGVLRTTDLAFDESGATKSKVVEVYEGSSILYRQVTTYGLAYHALDIYSIDVGASPTEKWIPKQVCLEKSADQYWKVVRTEKTEFKYGQHGYLVKINISGTRLARFASGAEMLRDQTRLLELYYLSNATEPEFTGDPTLSKEEIAEYKLLKWKIGLYQYNSVPIVGYTNYYLHPIHGTYADDSYIQDQFILYYDPINKKQVAITNEAYTPSYFASSTYTFMSSVLKTANYVIDLSEDVDEPLVSQIFEGDSLIAGEEYIQEERIKLIKNKAIRSTASVLSGLPFGGSNNSTIPQYTKYSRTITAQDDGFKNSTTQEETEFNEGIPPEHTRKPNTKELVYLDTDSNKPIDEKLNLHVYSYNIKLPPNSVLQKNPQISSTTLPLPNQSAVSSVFTKQLQDKELDILPTMRIETFYLPNIKVGDILSFKLLKDKKNTQYLNVKGKVKSINLDLSTLILDTREITYKYTFILEVTLVLPSATIEHKEINIQLPKEELEKEKPLNDVYYVLEPVDYSGFGENTAPVISVTRG